MRGENNLIGCDVTGLLKYCDQEETGIIMRNKSIDCMKGLGIILVVAAHAGVPNKQYIELFHMAVFFMISGYCHREAVYSENLQAVRLFIRKRIKSLYIPYILFNFMLLCLHNIFCSWNIYTDNPLFLQSDMIAGSYGLIGPYSVRDHVIQIVLTIGFVGGEQLAGTLWFLRALFEIEVFYVTADWLCRRLGIHRKKFWAGVTGAVMLIGYLLNTKGIHIVTGVEVSCYYFVFFIIGIYLQKAALQRLASKRAMLLVVSAGWIMISGILITCALVFDRYFPLFYIMNGIMGAVLLKCLADLSALCGLQRFFAYVGRHSMMIMLWHFLCFKLVSFLYIRSVSLPDYYLASFPYLNVRHLWIGYTAAGIVLPLAGGCVAAYVKKEIRLHGGSGKGRKRSGLTEDRGN